MRKTSLLFVLISCLTGSLRAEKPRVLYIGDSGSLNGFGQAVEFNLRNDGVDVYAVVDKGASPYHWLSEYHQFRSKPEYWVKTANDERHIFSSRVVPKVDDLIAEFHPEVVVVQGGVSLYGILRSHRRSEEGNLQEVRNLVKLLVEAIARTGARPYWILPAHAHEKRYPAELQKKLFAIVKVIIEENGGRAFNSIAVTHYSKPFPENDGVTYSPEQAAEFARKVCPDLRQFIWGDNLEIKPVTLQQRSVTRKPIPVSLTPF